MKVKNQVNFYVKIRSGLRTDLDVQVESSEVNESHIKIGEKYYLSSKVGEFIANTLYGQLENMDLDN